MKVFIVVDKPSVAEVVIESIQRVNPWPGAEVTVVPTIMVGLYRFDYPRLLQAADLPFVEDVAKRPGYAFSSMPGRPWFAWIGICGDRSTAWATDAFLQEHGVLPNKVPLSGFLRSITLAERLADEDRLDATLRNLLGSSDLIVKFTESDHRGYVAFYDLITAGGREEVSSNLDAKILDTWPTSLAKADLDQIVSDLVPGCLQPDPANGRAFRWRNGSANQLYGAGKDFFDYNWAVNASALLAAPLGRAGVPATVMSGGRQVQATTLLSKYALLLLEVLGRDPDNSHWRQGDIIHRMVTWKGTKGHDLPEWGSKFGGYASRSQIVQNLLYLGLLAQDGDHSLRLSEVGHRFIALLPKSAYDPDLPFRLDTWCCEWPTSRPQVEAYFRRFFGNIKRSNGMTSLVRDDVEAGDAARSLVDALGGLEAAADEAQVSVGVLSMMVGGGEVTLAQERAVALAWGRMERRLQNPS